MSAHVEIIGKGQPLVMIHGWGMHSGVWQPLVNRLSKTYMLYLVDLPGMGNSRPIEPYHLHALADEVALAQRYLAIEQIRFGERLRLVWELDPATDGARMPPLLLQPLVENAVRHGVEPSEGGATVRVSTRRHGSVVLIKVTNSVPAGAGSPGHGVALNNVRERLRLLHDVQGQFRSGLVDGVHQVRIEVPA